MSFNKKEYSKQNIPCDELEITYIPILKAVLTGFFSTMEADGHRNFFFFQKFSENFPSAPIGIHGCYPESSLGGKEFQDFYPFGGYPD